MGTRIIYILLIFQSLLLARDMGDYFSERGHYFEAVTEYKRLLFFKEYSSEDQILYKIADAYLSGGQKESAKDILIQMNSNSENSVYDRNALILLAKIYWDDYDYQSMRGVLDYFVQYIDTIKSDQVKYIKAWSYVYQAHWDEGIEELRSLSNPEYENLIRDVEEVSSVTQKSKNAALILSYIIPGTGQIYAGDYKNALYSFILVGSIGASMIWDIYQKTYFISLIKYFFLYTRYSQGGLKNLAEKIDRKNVDRIGDYLKTISEKYPNPIGFLESLRADF